MDSFGYGTRGAMLCGAALRLKLLLPSLIHAIKIDALCVAKML